MDRFLLQNWSVQADDAVAAQEQLRRTLSAFPEVKFLEGSGGSALIGIMGRNALETARIRRRLAESLDQWKIYEESTYELPKTFEPPMAM